LAPPRSRKRPNTSKSHPPASATAANDPELFALIDSNEEKYIARLAEFVAIQGVSAEPEHRGHVRDAVLWMKQQCDQLGGATSLEELGEQTLPDGVTKLPLPPVLLVEFGNDPQKRTLVLYAHLDVQPAKLSDGWDSEPFVLTERNGALYGRGASDDKGPATAWLAVIEAHRTLNRPLPINLRCVFEGMEESGSVGLPALVRRLGVSGSFLDPAAVDYLCISDNYWTGKKKPCITHGLRGCVYFHLEITCSKKDMHSGVIGGSVHEAMTDVVRIMASLVDSSGKILIDGIQDDVSPLTDAEMETYKQVEFDIETYKVDAGVDGITDTLLHSTKELILMHRWRFPTLSLHGIEGAFDGQGSKTVIPRSVKGKFSLRIVPDMHPHKVEELVRLHVDKEFAKLNSPNRYNLIVDKAGFPWFRDPNAPNFLAASKATVRVHGVEPCLTREGGSIPITQVFEEVCDAICVLLPIGASDDGAHSQNEKIDRVNLVQGIKTLSCYIHELSMLPTEQNAQQKAAAAAAAESRQYINKWRRRCSVNQEMFGCECFECQ
jgi:nonspecific dipeptidase